MICILMCGSAADWRYNFMLGAGFFALFIAGLLSAPFTFIFAMPAYVVIGAVLIVTRRPSGIEWAWKMALLGSCLILVFTSGLIEYYLGTVATVGRTRSEERRVGKEGRSG